MKRHGMEKQRKKNMYKNRIFLHSVKYIDITIPYDEISALYGYTEYGEKIFILKDGKFILPGTDKLNHGMEERQAERL